MGSHKGTVTWWWWLYFYLWDAETFANKMDCKVVVVGDQGVGKSALIRRFTSGEFIEDFSVMFNEKNQKIHFVQDKHRTKFDIFEFSDIRSLYEVPPTSILSADVFILCFSISSRQSLYSTITTWLQILSTISPSTPLLLVGCKSDLRYTQECVTHSQATTIASQTRAVTYVETSAKNSKRSTVIAFETAALRSFSKDWEIQESKPNTNVNKQLRRSRRESSEPRLRGSRLNCLAPCDAYDSPLSFRKKVSSLSSSSLASKCSTQSSAKSESSTISIITSKTPLLPRKVEKKPKSEETVIIKCQRLNVQKVLEEVEIEVPANVFNNLQSDDVPSNTDLLRHSNERRSLGSKLKKLILKN